RSARAHPSSRSVPARRRGRETPPTCGPGARATARQDRDRDRDRGTRRMKRKSEKIFEDLRKRVSGNLARLRTAQGISQMGLADLAGLHWRHLQKIEAGDSNVTLVTMARLASGLGVDPRELLGTAPERGST